MPRGAEVVRQWNLLQTIDAARHGVTVADLAKQVGVTKRTIWRDLVALQEAGFPLVDEKEQGTTRWTMSRAGFKPLIDRGLSLTQLCALYFSRSLVEVLAGTPFHEELKGIFDQFEQALPPRMRAFLDRLPGVLKAKPGPAKRHDEARQHETIARLLDATLHHRRVAMRYHSFSSQRTKDYTVDPYRIVYAEGGLYLFAYVPEYGQVRTFATERIKTLTVLEESFEGPKEMESEAFPHSLGANTGTPQRIELEFAARVAPYVKERRWHTSQKIAMQADGSLRMSLRVCDDWSLRSWILGFGPFVRVLSPAALAEEILDELEAARTLYAPRMEFELPTTVLEGQPILPFRITG
jgi:predicted DNA-binding transcriptional regulator YafY